ncbi:MAG: AgmX/PglI C-terminal domain-containing protein [Candidatus Coatesbacteria bacterium]|nr:AgmX/PglI C-terminal domain-containing protein [Candidatus Coatesbacteria bacterium]
MVADEKKNLFLKIDGKQYGPVSVETVKRWIEENRFGANDYLRKVDQNVWVQAKNVKHLNMMFHKTRKVDRTRVFGDWIEGVNTGALTALTYEGQKAERERIQAEQEALEQQRRELEERAKLVEMSKEEAAALDKRRAELADAERRLQAESDEIQRMETQVKKRRRKQTILVTLIIAVVVAVGIWLVIDLTGARRDLEEQIAQIDERLGEIDKRLAAIDDQISQARAAGDTALVAELEEQRAALQEERVVLEEELAEVTEERHADEPEVEETEVEPEGRTGRIAVAGDIQITGAGAGHSDRSKTTVAAYVNSALSSARGEYNELLKTDPNAAGSVTLIFTINPDGSVSGATGSNNNLPAGNLFGAMIRSLQGMRFQPIEDGSVKVSYPVSLSPN